MYPYRVFLSYYHGDRAKARKLRDFLTSIGLSVMWDETIPVGTAFNERIQTDISRAHLFVTLITEQALSRPWVHHETGYALGMRIPVFTVAVGAVSRGMTGDRQAAVVSARLRPEELAPRFTEGAITAKVTAAADATQGVFERVSYPEERAVRFTTYFNELRDAGIHAVVQQDGSMTSFNLPRSDVSSDEWNDREGLQKRTLASRQALHDERVAFDEHALVAGCKLVMDPTVSFANEGKNAARIRRTRLTTLRRALETMAPNDADVKVVARPREDRPNVTIIGDWFMALAQEGPKPQFGYRETLFTWHAPTVLKHLRDFNGRFDEMYDATDYGGKSSREWAIDLLDKTIAAIPGRPAPKSAARTTPRKKAGR